MQPRQLSIDELLVMYGQYQQLVLQRSPLERAVARGRLTGQPDAASQDRLAQLNERIAALSDAMTFALPSIWIGYKARAYRDEPQALTTLADLRLHCAKPGYICTKRFQFLNAALRGSGLTALDDEQLSPTLLLESAEIQDVLSRIEQDAEFVRRWQEYEYYTVDWRVAKWEGFEV
jgi:hypothetical protein